MKKIGWECFYFMNLDDKQNSSFADIPQKYQLCLNQISHKTLKKMYSNFSYIYLHIDSLNYNKEQIKNYIQSSRIEKSIKCKCNSMC